MTDLPVGAAVLVADTPEPEGELIVGDFIVKANPEDDLYLIWSTVVDDATFVGTRTELVEYLVERDHLTAEAQRTVHEARIARADATGSSTHDPRGSYTWADEAFQVVYGAPDDGRWYQLPRTRLTDYAHALTADDEAAAQALLEPQDWEGE